MTEKEVTENLTMGVTLGLVEETVIDGKKHYRLTAAGKERSAELQSNPLVRAFLAKVIVADLLDGARKP